MKFKLIENIYTKDGEYNPSKDSRYRKILSTPINQLSRDDIKYLFVISNSKLSDGYNKNGTQHTYWYIKDNDFNKALDDAEYYHSDDFDKAYKHFSQLQFPLTVYRAVRDDENVLKSIYHSRSWTTDINIYKDDNSIFKNCDNIIKTDITPNMIQNEYTISNYIFYSCGHNYGRHPESEITIKQNAKIENIEAVDKDKIL